MSRVGIVLWIVVSVSVCFSVREQMCREYAENELQRQWIAVIILILFS